MSVLEHKIIIVMLVLIHYSELKLTLLELHLVTQFQFQTHRNVPVADLGAHLARVPLKGPDSIVLPNLAASGVGTPSI